MTFTDAEREALLQRAAILSDKGRMSYVNALIHCTAQFTAAKVRGPLNLCPSCLGVGFMHENGDNAYGERVK